MACARRVSCGQSRRGIGGAELDSLFGFFVETDQAFGAAVAIDVFLREDGAQPAFERSASGVGRKFGNALAIAGVRAVEVGVERVGEFAGGGVFAGDAQGGEIQFLAIAREEDFPGGVVAGGTGAGQGEFVDAEA